MSSSSSAAYQLVVVGAGSAGVRAARMAAQRGLRTAVVEAAPLGGTCVNLGCIPKKLYSFAAHYGEGFEEAAGYGWRVGERPAFDWQTLKANRRVEISRLNRVYESLLVNAGATVVRGRARVEGAHRVGVDDGSVLEAERIVVATGGWPVPPDVPGGTLAISSNEIFDLEAFPRRLVVVGGGYIACEFASIFHGLGAQVTLLYRGEQLLRGFDDDVRHFVSAEMAKKGIDIRLGTKVASLSRVGAPTLPAVAAPRGGAPGSGAAQRPADAAIRVTLAAGVSGTAPTIDADQVLSATGRSPNTAGLGLADAGVAMAPNGAIVVDECYRTSVPSIYAIGDVIDRVQLTPVALAEAMALVEHLTTGAERHVDYTHIPSAVFTHPSIGTIGFSEKDAQARFDKLRIYRSDFKALRHTLSGSAERTLMKLVVDDASDRVVGLHMVGADAGETVQGFAVAMKAGATKAVFDATLGIHPTAAEEFVTMREPVAPRVAS